MGYNRGESAASAARGISMRIKQRITRAAGAVVGFVRKGLSISYESGRSLAEVLLPRTRFNYGKEVGDGRNSSVLSAVVMWVARTFPEAPAVVHRWSEEDEDFVTERNHDLVKLLERPNPFYPGPILWMATLACFLPLGEAFWLKVRRMGDVAGTGPPVEYWWIPNHLIEPKWPQDGSVYISHYDYRPSGLAADPIRLEVKDVIHFRYSLDPENYRRGWSPVKVLLREIFTDDEAANYTAALLKNLGVPGVVIWPEEDAIPANEDEAEEMRRRFRGATSGDNRGDPLIPSFRGKIEKLSFNPQEMNLRDVRKIPEERVSAVIGVPAIVVGFGAGLDRSTFSNFAEAREAAYESGIIPLQRILASQLSLQALPDFEGDVADVRVGFDNTDVRILQEDQKALVERLDIAIRGGWATVADGRRRIGLPVEDQHDVFLRPLTMLEIPAFASTTGSALRARPLAEQRKMALKLATVARRERRERSIAAAADRLADFFEAQAGRIASRAQVVELRAGVPAGRNGGRDPYLKQLDEVMAGEFERLQAALRGIQVGAITTAAAEQADALGPTAAIVEGSPEADAILERMGENIVNIDATTRQAVQGAIETANTRGYTAFQLANGVEDDGFAGLRGLPEFSRSRAETVARSETAVAENYADVAAWRKSGVVTGIEVLDGDGCGWTSHDDPDKANGSTRTIDAFEAYPLAHPNCVRVGTPLVE